MEKNSYELTGEQITRIRYIGKPTVMKETGWSISTFHRVVAGIPLSQKVYEAAIRMLSLERLVKEEEEEQTSLPPETSLHPEPQNETCYLCGRICQTYAAVIDDELRFVCRRGCFSKDDWHKISELVKREVDANMSLLAKVEGML